MGYFTEVEQELRDRAYELGDQFGEKNAVVDQLSEEFNLDREEILQVLQGDYDDSDYDYDDSMDGDHESALASAGWGTDEDYGYADEAY